MITITLVQANSAIGDFARNTNTILEYIDKCPSTDVFLFSELFLSGYMLYDYAEYEGIEKQQEQHLKDISRALKKHQYAIPGGIHRCSKTKTLRNSAFILSSDAVIHAYDKQALPNDDVFFEKRYFTRGEQNNIYTIGSIRLGLAICYDLWEEEYSIVRTWKDSSLQPDLLVWLSASPYTKTKHAHRVLLAKDAVQAVGAPLCMVNMVGANDEIVFDGQSFVMDADGIIIHSCALCQEDSYTFTLASPADAPLQSKTAHIHANIKPAQQPKSSTANTSLQILSTRRHAKPACLENLSFEKAEEILAVLELGLIDYIKKTNVPMQVHLGLSGGIDSALTAAIAVRALGKKAVTGILLPSHFTSRHSIEDAASLADNLGIASHTISIESIFKQTKDLFSQCMLKQPQMFAAQTTQNVSEENMQARIRGLLLMAYSNKYASMLLATGNKSEIATGYCTLYGDMCGSLNLIGDVYKTEVYALAQAINKTDPASPIPSRILAKPPSAELRENQKDSDSLPEYPVLDAILYEFIENKHLPETVAYNKRFDEQIVHKVWNLLTQSEYKRRQAPPIIKISNTAFGRGRIMPIAARIQTNL